MHKLCLILTLACGLLPVSPAWAGPREDFLAAGQAMRGGHLDEALRLYELVVKSDQTPKGALARAYHMMGTIHIKREQWKDAYANFAASLNLDPDNYQAHLGVGRAKQGEGMWPEAVAEYGKAIEMNPDLDIAYYYRGNAYKELGEAEKAQADLRRAREMKAAAQDSASPSGESSAASAQREPESAQEFLQRANQWGRQRQFERALADLDQAIRLKPDFAAAYNTRGLTQAALGHLPLAVADYTKALELDPEYLPVYNDRGRILLRMGRIKEAVADFDRAIDQDKDKRLKVYGLHNRGNARAAMEQYLAAVDDYTQAMALGYKPHDIYMARGEAYRLGRRYEQALDDFAQVKRMKPGLAAPYLFGAMALAALERYPEALQEAERAFKLKEGDREVTAALGQMLFLNGQFAEAARVMESLLPSDPIQRPSVLLWLFVARERGGQPSRRWLAEQAQGLDLNKWPGVLIDLFLGKATPQDVTGGTIQGRPTVEEFQHRQNQGFFFLSQYYLLRNIPNDARINLEHCIGRDMRGTGEYLAARAELKRMGPEKERKPRKGTRKAE